jgi:hypothetical protein
MEPAVKWYRSPRMWLELFALFNLAGLVPDIFLAHSTNFFRHRTEFIPLIFSMISPIPLVPAVLLLAKGKLRWWKILGYIVGWCSVLIGVGGLVLHLESQFFQLWTLASLVYAAPFAAPLAYTGIGFLLIMNRMVDADGMEWPLWVIFLALGGFVGNFIFSVTDHAQNGFYHPTEWIPVVSSALAIGFMLVPLITRVSRKFLRLCALVMLFQALVGLIGFGLHLRADVYGVGPTLFDRIVYGAPIFAPMLFLDLVILAAIGLWVLYERSPKDTVT